MSYLKLILAASVVLFSLNTFAAITSVRGYTTGRGTVVAPYYRTSPNGTTKDNWSTKGNINPTNGKPGYKNN